VTRVLISNHEEFHAEIRHFVVVANGAQETIRFKVVRPTDQERESLAADPLDAGSAYTAVNQIRRDRNLAAEDVIIVLVDGNLQDEEDDEYFVRSGSLDSTPSEGAGGISLVSLFYLRERSTFMRKAEPWWRRLSETEQRRMISDSLLLNLLCATANECVGLDTHMDCRSCIMDYCQMPTDLVKCLQDGLRFCPQTCQPSLQRTVEGRALLVITDRLRSQPFRTIDLLPPWRFDVFLCYNSSDRPHILDLAARLKERGIRSWFDCWQLQPGKDWKDTLETDLKDIRTAAVFLGPGGLGPLQKLEVKALIDGFVSRERPVIPVILPSVDGEPELPLFVRGLTWVDFRNDIPPPMEHLIWGITGTKPSALVG
jgi:TIR domain